MEAYQIHQLERMTGIKAHTIRMWEKRYGIISPGRTGTNRRSYNESQVRKLLNVSTLLARGQKISKIATLRDDELNALIEQAGGSGEPGNICSGYINDLVKSMLGFDEAAFEKIFAAAVTRLGIYEAMVRVIYPFLNKVGMSWCAGSAAPVQEHFASCIVKRKLMSATDGLMPPTDKTKKFLLFLPPGEWHEIALLFANYIIRSKGYETIYLGQSVPVGNVEKIVQATSPGYLLLFYISARPAPEVEQEIAQLSKAGKNATVLIAGNTGLFPQGKLKIKNTAFLNDVNGLMKYL